MESRPKPKPWVTNALTGETVSPNIDWLIDRLAALNPPEDRLGDYNAHARAVAYHAHVIDSHAHQAYGQWLSWRWRGDTTAIEIRGTQRPYAKRLPVKVSTERELKRLLRVAQGRSDKRWQTAWLGVSGETHRLIGWPPVIRRDHSEGRLVRFERDVAANSRPVSVRGLEAIMPTRADALSLIEAALRKHEAAPGTDRQKRQRDALADDVVRAVAIAYFDLTGKRGLSWDDVRGSHKGGLLDLGRDIEARFGGTGLFTVRRIKFIFETLEY